MICSNTFRQSHLLPSEVTLLLTGPVTKDSKPHPRQPWAISWAKTCINLDPVSTHARKKIIIRQTRPANGWPLPNDNKLIMV